MLLIIIIPSFIERNCFRGRGVRILSSIHLLQMTMAADEELDITEMAQGITALQSYESVNIYWRE